MADEQKPAEVPQEAAAPAAEPAAETKPAEEAPAAAEAAAEPAAEAEAAAPAEEAAKEEVKPIEEGNLEHKGQGANFPKNLIFSKKFVWFGTDAVDTKAIPSFKADKTVEVAHHIAAWASETGKGLLFYSEKSDKSAPNSAVLLADATEPTTEGTNKFHFTSKGHKHSFKAANTAERDNWVAQLKLKIAEAKELSATVTESETYKKTLESLKPAPPAKKEEKAPAAAPAAAAEPAKDDAAAPAAAEEAPKDAAAPAESAKDAAKERRSASRKRASIFGSFLGGKKEEKAEDVPAVPVPEGEAVAETAAEAPAAEAPAAEAAPATEAAPAEEAKAEDKKEEAKPTPAKRQSIFSNLAFGKKKAAEPEAAAKDAPTTTEVSETAPVIPAVESTEPLSAEVSSPANVPAETTEAAPATNGETKKEVKSEKRKSSLPFGFGGKKEKAAGEEEGGAKSPGPFSKFRATIKGKGKSEKTDKAAETAEEVPAVPTAEGEAAKEAAPATEEAAKPAEAEAAPAAEPAAAAEEAAKPVEAAPAVAASA